MKKLMITLCLIPLLANAQEGDIRDLRFKVLNYQNAIETFDHKVTTGTKCLVFSAAVITAGIMANYTLSGEIRIAGELLVFGSITALVGIIKIYTAHRDLRALHHAIGIIDFTPI